jgi:hypothetical protein
MRTLVIGGTGMLERASLELASQSSHFTMVASTRISLEGFESLARSKGSPVRSIRADWNDREQFLGVLEDQPNREGTPDLVVAWLHEIDLGPVLASKICRPDHSTVFLQVCGSMAPRSDTFLSFGNMDVYPSIDYRLVILGFRQQGNTRRWLTHEEISDGVLKAVKSQTQISIVGELDE